VPSTPGKPLIMSFSSRTVNLSWAPPLDSHNAPVLEYVIRQRKGEDSSWETTRQAYWRNYEQGVLGRFRLKLNLEKISIGNNLEIGWW
jgi:hypothetical protein